MINFFFKQILAHVIYYASSMFGLSICVKNVYKYICMIVMHNTHHKLHINQTKNK